MAVSPIPQAPFRQERKVLLTPIVGDVLFSEVRDCSRIELPAYGTPHPNTKKWPTHKLVFIKTVEIERDGLFEFFYAADRADQDLYNFSFGTRGIGNREFRIVVREYVTPRSEFDPDYGGFNEPMPDVPSGTFDGVEYVFFDKLQKKIDQPELDSLYVAETVTYIEKAFLQQKISFTAQKPDLIPQKFRPNVPELVTEGIEAGLVQIPTLGPLDLQVSQNQLNPNVKLVRSVTRSASTNSLTSPPATPLGGEEYGDIVTRTVQESLVNEGTIADTGIDVISSVVESLGDGKAVKQTKRAKNGWPTPVEDEISRELTDTIPAKFKGNVTQSKKSRKISAVPNTVTLTGNEKAKLFKRETPDRVDETTITEVVDSGNTLLGDTQTNNGQLATVEESLHKGTKPTVATSSTTVDVSVESLGGDLWLKREVKVPAVFANKTVSKTKPDNIPAKFQTQNPTSVTQETVEGQIPTDITLGPNDESKSEDQVTPHLKRVSTSTRVVTTGGPLRGDTQTNNGQLATVEESLHKGTKPTVATSATVVDVSVESLGGDLWIKREVKVPAVFSNKTVSKTKPDNIPAKFQTQNPTSVTQETVEGQIPTDITLGPNDESKSEDQVTPHLKRVSTSTRNVAADSSLSGTSVVSAYGGVIATTTEKLITGPPPTAVGGLNVLSDEITPLGGGRFAQQTVTSNGNFPRLRGQQYNSELDVDLPYDEEVVSAGSAHPKSDVTPIDQWRSKTRKMDFTAIADVLKDIHLKFPTEDTIQLPNTLLSAKVVAVRSSSRGAGQSRGTSGGYSLSSSVSVSADVIYEMAEGYQGPTEAEINVFFLPKDQATTANILQKCNALAFPEYAPKSDRVVILGNGLRKSKIENFSQESYSSSESGNADTFSSVANLPPSIHGPITFEIVYRDFSETTPTNELTEAYLDAVQERLQQINEIRNALNPNAKQKSALSLNSSLIAANVEDVQVTIEPASLSATSPPFIQAGRFVKTSTVSLYGYGLVKVTAVVVVVKPSYVPAASGGGTRTGYNRRLI